MSPWIVPSLVCRTPGFTCSNLLKINEVGAEAGSVSKCGSKCGGSAGLVSLRVPPRFACFVVSSRFARRPEDGSLLGPLLLLLELPPPHAAANAAARLAAPVAAIARLLVMRAFQVLPVMA
jgi:hypothetical protein